MKLLFILDALITLKPEKDTSLAIMREAIGPDRGLMVDANQRWDVGTAIEERGRFRQCLVHGSGDGTSRVDAAQRHVEQPAVAPPHGVL